MSDAETPRPPRRPRYRGTHPRQFEQKYKELQPERYPDEIAKVIEGGKTPAGMHRPIMVEAVLQVLAIQPGATVVDCTLGYGGHATEFLRAVQPGGRLLGFDLDPLELPRTEARLRATGIADGVLQVWRQNFAGVAAVLAEVAPAGVNALFADLGVSSMQLDDPARGFTFKTDGPLDMRMNPTRGLSAADWLTKWTPARLAQILRENADEPFADEFAEAILSAQAQTPLTTTRALAEVVRSTILTENPRSDAELNVRRVFQALRIAVNSEFESLDALLRQLPGCLKPGGRVAILTFHSGEDRRVKAAFKDGVQAGVYAEAAREVIRASSEEQRANPRSSSAKLRWAIRSHTTG